MKTTRNFTIVLTAIIVFSAVLAIAATPTAAWAAPGSKSNECGLIGTWSGYADAPWPYSSAAWLAVLTAGSKDDKNGEMLMNWVSLNSSLLTWYGTYPASRMTPGHGVWEQTGKGQYGYTWYAYGVDALGNVLYSVSVRGLATLTDCNNAQITYTYEVFNGLIPPQDLSSYTPDHSTSGNGAETRVPPVDNDNGKGHH
jgi:hypothetical protein